MIRIASAGVSLTAISVALTLASPCRAQTTAAPSTATAQSGGDEIDGQDIVVTARRVSETVRDVPAAITAISGDNIDNLLVDNAASLIRQIPGATLVTSGPAFIGDISLRGQGGGRIGSSESATGIYRDGHYAAGGQFGGRTLNRLDLFDLERIEVLRGPQGALYGRNAVGGSVNAIARKPDFGAFNGWGKFGYDSFRTLDIEGAVSVPLVKDKLAFRVAGFGIDQEGGYITNVKTGNKVDQNNTTGVRAALSWKVTDNITTSFTFENYYTRTPGFGSLGYRPTRNDGSVQDPSRFERILSSEAYAHIKQRTVYWDTTITTGYGDWHFNFDYKHRDGNRYNEDYSHFLGFEGVVVGGVPINLNNNEADIFENAGGQIYLTSRPGARLSWLFGVDGIFNRDRDNTYVIGTATPNALRQLFRDDNASERLQSMAVFGSIGYDLTDKLNIGVEVRAQRDHKKFDFARTRSTANSLTVPFTVDLEDTWTQVLPTATLRYKFNSDQTAYVRFATGYRPGGFNTGLPGDYPNAEQLIPFGPENVYGGEVGWKGSFLKGAWTASLAAYYTHTNNVQEQSAASLTNPVFLLQNVGSDNVYGVEFETRGRIKLRFGRLDLTAALSTSNGNFGDGTRILNNGTFVNLSGLRVDRTRDFKSALGAVLNVPFATGVAANFGVNVQTESGGFSNATNTVKLANFTLVDLTAGLTIDGFRISAFVRNVGNRIYLLQALSNNSYYNAPRQYGGSVKVTF